MCLLLGSPKTANVLPNAWNFFENTDWNLPGTNETETTWEYDTVINSRFVRLDASLGLVLPTQLVHPRTPSVVDEITQTHQSGSEYLNTSRTPSVVDEVTQTHKAMPEIALNKAIDLRSKCGHFRILVIGRANSGKTTLLKKVCNSVEDPEIFSPSGEKVRETYYLRTRRVHYLIPTRSIAARSHHSAGVIRGTNHNPIQVHSHLLFHSVDCTTSIMNSYLKAIPNSFSTILADSNPAL